MDPNANLKEALELCKAILNISPCGDIDLLESQSGDAERLAEIVQALDEWLAKGGFLPKRWRNA